MEKQVTVNGITVSRTEQTADVITRVYCQEGMVQIISGGETTFTAKFAVDFEDPTGKRHPAGVPVRFSHTRRLGGCSRLLVVIG